MLILGAVKTSASQPVRPGELERVVDSGAPLLGRVDEEQATERSERLTAQRSLGLLIQQQHTLAGADQLSGRDQTGQATADHDCFGFQLGARHVGGG